MTCGETRENPVFDEMNLIRAKIKATLLYCKCFTKLCFVRRLIIGGIAFLSVFILKHYTVTCQTKYFMDKMNYVSICEPNYSKTSDILSNNY